jgi:inner membrane protein
MDNLTHSLVGALLGQCGLKKKTGLAMPALIIGANLPDVDAACFFWLEGQGHLGFRRGITHGPIAWFLLPLILAGLLWGWDRWQGQRGTRPEKRLPVSFNWLYLLSFVGCLSHPALDWMNVYGIRLLEPFSSVWFYGDVLFIIDVWLWALLIGSVWFSLRRERRGGEWVKPARTAFAVMLAYIGVNAAITWYSEEAARLAEPYPGISIASPVPFTFWHREMITGNGDGRWYIDGEQWGDFDLLETDKPDIIAAVPAAQPFLFWSRTPLIHVTPDGRYLLRDARFLGRGEGGFTIELPAEVCEPQEF